MFKTPVPSKDHDWDVNGTCSKCHRPITTTRTSKDFTMQRDEFCYCATVSVVAPSTRAAHA